MPDYLQFSDFLPYLKDTFVVRLDEIEPIVLELVEAKELGAAYAQGRSRAFSLIFQGPVSQQYLLQSTYHLEHAQMGVLDLFIVPLGLQEGRMQYQAIFN